MVMSDDELRINQNVPTENQSGHDSVAELNAGRLGEEGSHESKQDEDPKRTKQVWHPACEVIFRLARKEREEDEDSQREDQSL